MKLVPVITLILACVTIVLTASVKTYNINELPQPPTAERSTLSALTAPVTNIVNIITNTFICSGNATYISIICGNQGGNTTAKPGPVDPPATTPGPPTPGTPTPGPPTSEPPQTTPELTTTPAPTEPTTTEPPSTERPPEPPSTTIVNPTANPPANPPA